MIALLPLVILGARHTDVMFVRHGETVANATGRYNSRTLNVLSAKGLKEAADLTKRLKGVPSFDLILVSPSERVLRTISPYLKAVHKRAIVWPLLYECCTQKRSAFRAKGPLRFGSRIILPKDIASEFILDPMHNRLPIAPDYATGLIQISEAVGEFQRFYRGKRVLLVGHAAQGGHFIHSLTGKWIKKLLSNPLLLPLF
jgi:broad specificity phosphatase PhoE